MKTFANHSMSKTISKRIAKYNKLFEEILFPTEDAGMAVEPIYLNNTFYYVA